MQVPVLYPTMDDMMRPVELFIERHEKKIGKIGLAKIVPPAGWSPRPKGSRQYEQDPDFTIERCIKQVATGSRGLYRFLLVEQKPMSLKETFQPHAMSEDNQPGTSDPAEVERKYWRTVGIRPPLYGADIHFSLFDEKCKVSVDGRRRALVIMGYDAGHAETSRWCVGKKTGWQDDSFMAA